MPTVVHRRRQPSHRKKPVNVGNIVRSVVFLCVLTLALYREYVFEPHARHISSSNWEDTRQQDSLPPTDYNIKGNISVTNGARLYHLPGMRDYEETVIDTNRGERWFRTEDEAIASGWRKAGP